MRACITFSLGQKVTSIDLFFIGHLGLRLRVSSLVGLRFMNDLFEFYCWFTWFGRNLQSIFLSLKDLRNYKCFSPVSKMK